MRRGGFLDELEKAAVGVLGGTKSFAEGFQRIMPGTALSGSQPKR